SNKTTLQFPSSFTPDGKRLAYYQVDGRPQIWSVDVENDAGTLKAGKPVRFLTNQFRDVDPVFSPDGRWIAYSSNESGRPEVCARFLYHPLRERESGKSPTAAEHFQVGRRTAGSCSTERRPDHDCRLHSQRRLVPP